MKTCTVLQILLYFLPIVLILSWRVHHVLFYCYLDRMLELLAESKALARLGIPLPEVAQNALNQVC